MKGLWEIMVPVKAYIITAMGLSIIGVGCTIIGYVLLAYLLSAAAGARIGIFNVSVCFNQAFIILAAIVIFSFLIKYYAFIISHLGAFKLEEVLRTKVTEHWAKIPLGYILPTGAGALKKVLLEDVKNLHAFVADSTPLIARSIAGPVASLIALLILDYRLALAGLSVSMLGGLIMY